MRFKCMDCKFYDPYVGGGGACRRYAPMPTSDPNIEHRIYWPHVHPHDWCAQFQHGREPSVREVTLMEQIEHVLESAQADAHGSYTIRPCGPSRDPYGDAVVALCHFGLMAWVSGGLSGGRLRLTDKAHEIDVRADPWKAAVAAVRDEGATATSALAAHVVKGLQA